MSSDHMDVINSSSATEIQAYCRSLAQELGLTLADVWWTYALGADHHPEAPCHLWLSVTEPFMATPDFWFTCEQVRGYTPGTTKVAIESEIRKDLETRRLGSMD
jgi:hypothetical protein